MTLKGKDAHLRRLKAMSGNSMVKAAGAVLYVGADLIRERAHVEISRGSVSGKNHVASKTGEPPNRDTGILQAHIEAAMVGPLTAQVTSSAPYAAIHEFGGTINHPGGTPYFMRAGKAVFVSKSGAGAFHGLPVTKPHTIKMPARPYMRPARDKMEPEIQRLFAAKINDLVKRSGQ